MGYRAIKPDASIWAKPIGYHLFFYDINAKKFINCIDGGKGWNESEFNGKSDFLAWLKNTECWSYTQWDGNSSFEFLSNEELLECYLNCSA